MRKIQLALLTASLAAAACAAPPDGQPPIESKTAKAVIAPPGAGFIEKVHYDGTGCPARSFTNNVSEDKQAVTSVFSAFSAEISAAAAPEDATSNCLITMEVNVPAGFQYSLESVHHRGYLSLEAAGMTASRQSLYMISGSPVHLTPPARFTGPFNDNFEHGDVESTENAPAVWSPCGGGQVLWIATQTQLHNGGRSSRQGLMVIDSIDTELEWKACPQ